MGSKHSDNSLLTSSKSLILSPFRALLGRLRRTPHLLLSHGGIASSSSNTIRSYRYDVFISFRGVDTRNNLVDHLYNHLDRKGIFVFKDDQRLQKGEFISPQLVQAIKDSRLSIIVFSTNYASSSWCLDEMATIVECHQQFNQTVYPVFYDVDPSHVRKQNGVYEKAFALHTQNFRQDPSKVYQWKTAMTTLAKSAGWDVRNKPEFEEIENIVQAVTKKLGHRFSGFADNLVGIQPRVETLENLLKLTLEDNGSRVLGIWGMSGIGKTTLATALYDRISYQFDASCFIENVSKIYRDGGACAIQKQILHQTLREKNLETCSPSEISGMVRNRLHNRKILVVLDNVDMVKQLEELAIEPKLFQRGSRMIITTRDEHIIKAYGANVKYQVPLVNDEDARDLFYKKAFKSDCQSSSCVELVPKVLKYAQGLPLAIKVLGSFLCARDVHEWSDALDRLENNPDNEIMDVLQISLDGLHHKEKEIFLHITCFFKGEREDYVKRVLDGCHLNPHIGISRIIELSLITIRNQEIHMHDMLQELGKKIVQDQCIRNPALWSRLWLHRDLYQVLMTQSETNNVEAIVLRQEDDVFMCKAEGFSKLKNLKLLILYQNSFEGTLDFLSNNLRYLFWHGYPFPSLPSKFKPYSLTELNLPESRIQRLWEGRKSFSFLERVDLSNSKCLIETPDFELCREIKRLDLTGCTNLSQVHSSIGLLSKLTYLSLRNCSNLVSLDFRNACNLSSLKVLSLSGCTKLESMPDITGASNLEYLDIEGCTSLSTLHESIGTLSKNKFLSLKDCTNLVSLPDSINSLTSLMTLHLCGCSKLAKLPLNYAFSDYSFCMKSLIFLDLGFCNLLEVPDAIGELRYLERLDLQGNKFYSVPDSINKLSCLAYLNLAHCHNLGHLPLIPSKSESLVGRYFQTTSGSRDHRSGLYVFDCPKLTSRYARYVFTWLTRLVKQPRHFRCGFDIVTPRSWDVANLRNSFIPNWFDHKFTGESIISIVHCDVDDDWIGFAFCVAFEADNPLAISSSSHHSSSSPLPHPFYLSCESEYTEQRFDMTLNLELDKSDDSQHFWTIYISKEHCHFIESGANITFKSCPGLVVKEWGLRRVVKQDIEDMEKYIEQRILPPSRVDKSLIIEYIKKRSSSSMPKIQLPYNWLVNEEDEVENFEAKAKENDLCNLGL